MRQRRRGEGQVLAQQDVPPGRGAQHEDAEAVAVDAELIAHQLQQAEEHEGDRRRSPTSGRSDSGMSCRPRSSIEPKTAPMISGVSSTIFASGDRTSDRKPPSAIAETGSDRPGQAGLEQPAPAACAVAAPATRGGRRPALAGSWPGPGTARSSSRYARQRLAAPISVIPASPEQRRAGPGPRPRTSTPSGSQPTGRTTFASRADPLPAGRLLAASPLLARPA